MAQTSKINQLTTHFLREYDELDKSGKLPMVKDLAVVMGIRSNKLSEIRGKRLNIQPEEWEKFRIHFNLSDFSDSTGNNEVVYDSKEGILRLLNKALDENARHAAANEKNAAASDKNATAMIELVRILGVKLNSVENAPASVSSPDSEDKPPLPEEQIPLFEGNKGKRSAGKKKQKDIST